MLDAPWKRLPALTPRWWFIPGNPRSCPTPHPTPKKWKGLINLSTKSHPWSFLLSSHQYASIGILLLIHCSDTVTVRPPEGQINGYVTDLGNEVTAGFAHGPDRGNHLLNFAWGRIRVWDLLVDLKSKESTYNKKLERSSGHNFLI